MGASPGARARDAYEAMKRTLTIFLLALGLSSSLWSDEKPNQAEIKEILELLGYTQAYPQVYKSTYDSLKGMVMKAPAPKELEKEFHLLVDEIMEYFSKQASWDVYEGIYIDYFNTKYSSNELKELRDFLKTSAGQKFYINMQVMNEKITSITQERMAYIVPEMQKMIASWMTKHEDIIKKLKQ